jgi:hypothetical protein
MTDRFTLLQQANVLMKEIATIQSSPNKIDIDTLQELEKGYDYLIKEYIKEAFNVSNAQ